MNTQTVSHSTAAKLAAAGFPQPAPAPGQWWGDESTLVLIWRKWKSGSVDYYTVTILDGTIGLKIEYYFDAEDFNGLVFLPTAGDILREIHSHFAAMQGYSVNIELSPIRDGFRVDVFEDLPFDAMTPITAIHIISAEAAALAWLEMNKG